MFNRPSSLRLPLLAILAAAPSLLNGVEAKAAGAPQAQASAAPALPALTSIAECVRDRKALAAVLVIDASGSLKDTDPKDQRVTAAKAAVESLAGLAEHDLDGEHPKVSISVGSFGVGFVETHPWTDLDYTTVEGVKTSIDTLATHDNEIDTDYAAALIGAKKSLETKVPGDGTNGPCRAIIWFTDGKYDIQDTKRGKQAATKDYASDIRLDRPGGPAALEKAGQELLCRQSGLVDELRTAKIGNLAVGLTTELKEADQGFLTALAMGTGPGGAKCGGVDARTTGAYVPVSNLSQLIAQFDAVGATIGYGVPGPVELDIPICAASPCPEGTKSLPIDVGISRFHLNVQTGSDDVSVVLTSPQGTVTLDPKPGTTDSTTKIGTTPLRVVWLSADVATLDVDLPVEDEAWAGEWTLALVRAAGATAVKVPGFRTFLYGTTAVELQKDSKVRTSAESEVKLGLLARRGGPAVSTRFLSETTVQAAAAIVSKASATTPSPLIFDPSGMTLLTVDKTTGVATGKAKGSATDPVVETVVQVTTKSGWKLAPVRVRAVPSGPPPPAPHEKGSGLGIVPLALGGIAILAALGGLMFFLLRRRRAMFIPLGHLRVAVHPARVAIDAVSRARVVWLTEEGQESQLRLNSAQFTNAFPTQRKKSFEVGPFRFTRHNRETDGLALVESPGKIVMSGPHSAEFALQSAKGSVAAPGDLHPFWVFSSERRQLGAGYTANANVTVDVSPTAEWSHQTSAPTGDTAFDGWLLIAATDDSELSAIERSVINDLPTLARQILRTDPSA